MLELFATLILLHGPDTREIVLNPSAITSMHAAIEGKKNEMLAQAIHCIINTSDGKFVSVIETCKHVEDLIRQSEKLNQKEK